MRLIHNSRKARFRAPFGAVEADSSVKLFLGVEDADISTLHASVRLWIDGVGESFVPMTACEGGFSATLAVGEPKIIWYSFVVRADNGETAYMGAPWGRVGGEGSQYTEAEPPSFQITVYRHRKRRPSWYEKGMVYQIFPDRYRRDDHWRERTMAALETPHEGIQWRMVEDWTEPPSYDRNPDGSIRTWDFYGGSLKGIEEDLPRIAELGFTAIYLNPIFEAASNHRYDTSDYLKIDPVLGTEEDFTSLCESAKKLGISIILDGVFNHTGDDSIYFNRYGNYPGVGAWQSEDSPWRDAYYFHEDGSYDCWWGIGNMPALNEGSEKVQELLLGEDGVVRHWLRAGARGWRLDVADELSDELIAGIKKAVLEEKPDGLLLGEVWEDASNKISYGKLRKYLQGDELDSAMDYPFRDMVLGFLMGTKTASDAAEDIETLRENYPAEALSCALNLLGSHDRPRIASVLGGGPDESKLPESERGRWRLDEQSMGLAKGRFWLATLMQMTFPGVPSVYYGDELGLEGLSDPGNRRPLPRPTDPRDYDFTTIFKNAAAIRRALPFMVDGTIEAFAPCDDVLAYTRTGEDGEAATVLINRGNCASHTVRIPAHGEMATDVISGKILPIEEDGCVTVELWGFGSAVVYFHKAERLQKPLTFGAGTVCHITSVPNGDKPGTLGEPSKRFVDHLAAMGMRYWQVLPVNPTDSFGSPYAGPSAFAGNVALLPESAEELRAAYEADLHLAETFECFIHPEAFGKHFATSEDWKSFVTFLISDDAWLKPYCAFMALKARFNGASRLEWPAEYARYDEKLFEDEALLAEAGFQAWCQHRFQLAWHELHTYANEHGIEIIGDIPMYVSEDSADAWASPKYFHLDAQGRTTEGAGAPPDNFAPEGQLWGNPTYRWDVLRKDGYSWWIARLQRMLNLYDRVRLDHFLGFHNYFSIEAGKKCADGRWLPGPGVELFERVRDQLGDLPFIAEDLGILTPGVRALTAQCGFPGMDVLQFENYDVRNGINPWPEKILYTSTHDTPTLAGWCEATFVPWGDKTEAHGIADILIMDALNTDATLVIMPLQDILRLGDDARMNTPGVAEGNWTWQATEDQMMEAEIRFSKIMVATGRSACTE